MVPDISQLRELAVQSLRRMYRPEQGIYAFRLRRADGRDVLEGESVRYTGMALLGLLNEPEDTLAEALHDQPYEDVADGLVARLPNITNLGDVAVIWWVCRAAGLDDQADAARARLMQLDPLANEHPTVERAWVLSACAAGDEADCDIGPLVVNKLLAAQNAKCGVYAHQDPAAKVSRIRRHVACFADLVYPTMALADWGATVGDSKALNAARLSADYMAATQGPEGQWWWHFDQRTGKIVEGYPVYSVHQDSMAPMALFAAAEACGTDYNSAIRAGLSWMFNAPEIGGSLVDTRAKIIWRKVCRREPNKFTRLAQASMSSISASWRVPGLNLLFPPRAIDAESRPYHMGWILYAWRDDRCTRFGEQFGGTKHDTHKDLADAAVV